MRSFASALAGRVAGNWLLAGLIALATAHALAFARYTVDDAFISYRYAENLVAGLGLVFNAGERVEGYTNFLWTMLHVPAIAVGFPPDLFSKLIGLAANGATLGIIARVSAAPARPLLLQLVAVALLAANSAFAVAAVGGLETALFSFFVTWGTVRAIRAGTAETTALESPALPFALASLTRPEGLLAFGVALAVRAALGGPCRATVVECLRWLGVLALFVVPHEVWRLSYYGAPLPNTFYAKTGAGLAQYYKGFLDLADFTRTYHAWLLVPALAGLLARRREPLVLYSGAVVVAFGFAAVYEGGDWIPFFRLIAPALPLLYLLVQEAAAMLDGQLSGRPRALLRAMLVLLIAGTLAPVWWLRPQTEFLADVYARVHDPLAFSLRGEAGAIALMDIGRIGYYSGRTILDTSGLTDPVIARSPGGLIDKRFDFGYIVERRPAYIILTSTTNFQARGEPPSDFPIDRRIYEDPRFALSFKPHFTMAGGVGPNGKGYYLALFKRRS